MTLHPVFCLLAAFNHPVFDNRPQLNLFDRRHRLVLLVVLLVLHVLLAFNHPVFDNRPQLFDRRHRLVLLVVLLVLHVLLAFNHPVFDNRPHLFDRRHRLQSTKHHSTIVSSRKIASDCVKDRIFIQEYLSRELSCRMELKKSNGRRKICAQKKVSSFSKDEDPPLSNMNI